MKFSKLHIDGYGLFTNREIELTPGLHIVAGPNEQGKSTLRGFITDMLYGQKRNTAKRMYEDSNTLREPWAAGGNYGGRLEYILDAGTHIEVHRSFDRKTESVQVFDRTNAEDITAQFPVLKNRESTFAEAHLKMTKSVFLGMATISHVSLADLGDREALSKIREKMLSLTDSGNENSSAEHALQWLADRSHAIGQKNARTKPLPKTRARLDDLEDEYRLVYDARQEMAVIEKQRQTVLEDIGGLLNRKSALERDLRMSEQADLLEQLSRAEELNRTINELTRESFELGHVRDFPLNQETEAARLATLVDTAQSKSDALKAELKTLQSKLDSDIGKLESDGVSVMKEVDPDLEVRLVDLDLMIHQKADRLDQLEEKRGTCQERYMTAQTELSKLPDFSRHAADPIKWISQLTSSFDHARSERDRESDQVARLDDAIDDKTEALKKPEILFSSLEDPGEALLAYSERIGAHAESLRQLDADQEDLEYHAGDKQQRMPMLFLLSGLMTMGLIVCAVVVQTTGNQSFYLPAVICLVIAVLFGGSGLWARRGERSSSEGVVVLDEDRISLEEAFEEAQAPVNAMIEEAECHSLRELEALFDTYQRDGEELAVLESDRDEQREIHESAQDRLNTLFTNVSATFRDLGDDMTEESEVAQAGIRAMGRYQEYRDAKRRGTENRDALKRHETETKDVESELESLRQEELDRSLELRQFLRENHYAEEKNFDSAVKALRNYQIKSAQLRQKQGLVDVSQGQISMLQKQVDEESQLWEEHRSQLGTVLQAGHSADMDEFTAKANQARRYQELMRDRTALEEQMSVLLGDTTLEALRNVTGEDAVVSGAAIRSHDEIADDLSRVAGDLDAMRKREHALHIMLTERGAGLRTINEVDEDRETVGNRLAQLEEELEAAAYAASKIDEVTRERHVRIAPQLAQQASGYLREITDGAYNELFISRDMQISIRIPQTKALNPDPERLLSKGTVDQIYLALRLAMVMNMSQGAESIPMVLDDPFANYDDHRLTCALRLLKRVAETNQVLVFTCRQDVIRAAEAVQAPILNL